MGGFVGGSKGSLVGLGFTLHKWLLMDDHMQVNAWGAWFILSTSQKDKGFIDGWTKVLFKVANEVIGRST